MNVRARLIPALCALAVTAAAPAPAASRSTMIEATLAAASSGGATGVALFRAEGTGGRFSIRTSGLAPGACEVRVDGALQAFLFVDERGFGEILFDTALFEKTAAGGGEQEADLGPLTFDPRGRTLQISRNGQVLLEAEFPARPTAGRRQGAMK